MTDQPAPENASKAFAGLSADDKKAAVKEALVANPDLVPTDNKDKTTLWKVLLLSLFTLAALSIVGAVILLMTGKDASSLLVVASAVVAGTIGLFSQSPTST